jgi:stage V sporulation protein AE
MAKRKVILVTDGDQVAKVALEKVAYQIGGRCISSSAGNPSLFSGPELVKLIQQAAYDPVLVMFDDCGSQREGDGEKALKYVATHPEIEVLGAIAVASNCFGREGTPVHMAIDRYGNLLGHGVDKWGQIQSEASLRIYGDTVEVLNQVAIPIIIGIGDVGKMGKYDDVSVGVPITTKAVQIILEQYQKNQSSSNSNCNFKNRH